MTELHGALAGTDDELAHALGCALGDVAVGRDDLGTAIEASLHHVLLLAMK